MSNPFDFDAESLDRLERPFRHGGKWYAAVEASEQTAADYRNYFTRTARMEDGEIASYGDVGNVEPLMLSKCVFRIEGEGTPLRRLADGRPDPQHAVPMPEILGWPARVCKPVFAWIKEVSEMDEAETEEVLEKRIAKDGKRLARLKAGRGDAAKNGHGSTTAGSASAAS